MISLVINGEKRSRDIDSDTPLLWVRRDELNLKGTKFGCGAGLCGACTVHVGGTPTRACQTRVVAVNGQEITTIEGLCKNGELHPLQQAWVVHGVHQSGY